MQNMTRAGLVIRKVIAFKPNDSPFKKKLGKARKFQNNSIFIKNSRCCAIMTRFSF